MTQRPRRALLLALASLVALVAAFPATAGEAQRSQMVAECTNVYRYVPTPVSWSEARRAAREMGPGAHLATVSSWDENVCVRQAVGALLGACASARRLGGGGCPPENVWIGGGDARAEGIWRWLGTDGTGGGVFFSEYRSVAAFTNWAGGEPNDFPPGEDCLMMRLSDGAWNDGVCDTAAGYVVEFERRTPRRDVTPL